MNILFLNTTYLCGGAEKVANQIFEGMRRRGHTVYEIVSYHKRPETLPDGVTALYRGAPMLMFNRILTGNHSNASLSIPYSLHRILHFIRKHRIDVVHLHNAHGNFLGIEDIRRISEVCPVVWTLHDFWALTGHCTYPTDCPDLWTGGCPSCPRLQNYPPIRKDIAAGLFQAKERAFRTSGVCYTVPSRWMKEQFLKSHLKEQECILIPNSLNTDCWVPHSKKKLRETYGLPHDKHILAFVAADPQKKLKGMDVLLESLHQLPDPENYLLLVAGREGSLESLQEHGFSIRHFGYITGQPRMNEFYALADLLINPSSYETFGLVNIEAMASGTPVIAFSVCAMEEIITPDTGWCLPDISSRLLARAIEDACADPDGLTKKSRAARERAVSVYSEETMLDAFEKLYAKTAAE